MGSDYGETLTNAMTRFFIRGLVAVVGESVKLPQEEHAHALVLRLKPNETVVVCDAGGVDYLCSVVSTTKRETILRVEYIESNSAENPYKITLYQALMKADKMEFVIQKGIEMGVTAFVPVVTAYSVPQKEAANKHARWERIAHSAAEQCGRGIIPEVSHVMTLDEAIKDAQNADCKLVAYEREQDVSLRSALRSIKSMPEHIGLFVGSEGGISENEVERLTVGGFKSITLGKRILRAETAGLYVVSNINYALEV